MAGENSVSRWLDGLREGNDADVQRLWDRYFQRLVNLASARLPGHARRVTDEEDVAPVGLSQLLRSGGARAVSRSSSIATTSGASWSPSPSARLPRPCGTSRGSSAAEAR